MAEPIVAAPPLSPVAADAEALYQRALAMQAEGRHLDALHPLNEAAKLGHVPAMTLLGGQLLSGRGAPPDPPAGARLVMLAARLGGGYANALAATLVASGIGRPPDWLRALDHLQRAAEAGYARAADQLRVLAAEPAAGRPPDASDPAELRRAVNVDAWRTGVEVHALLPDPPIRAFPKLVSPLVCDWLIGRARDRLGPAKIYDAVTGGPTSGDSRRNSAAEFGLVDVDLVLLLVRERLAAASGLDALAMHGPQILHYAVGERFTPHFDFLDPTFEGHARDIAGRGQRIATLLIYLNEGLEGGETDFPALGLRHRGGRGDGLMFMNVDGEGRPDRRTLHAGLPPTSGEKWLLSQWVRDRRPPGLDHPRLAEALR